MKREIKFRAFIHPYCGGGVPQELYNSMDYSGNSDLGDFFDTYKPHFFEIMQFTGLKDKNGNEIYEDDIVTDGVTNGKVFYNKDNAQFMVDFSPYDDDPQELDNNLKWATVIGNIHETPELLEKAETVVS